MKRPWFQLTAFFCGLLFALGLGVGGMSHPGKVLAFLNVTGAWDPGLAFVMAAAVAVYFTFARRSRELRAPRFDSHFALPARTAIDQPLLLGSALFGVGWGLHGYCPGPAVMAVASLHTGPVVFVAAMMLSQWVVKLVRRGGLNAPAKARS